jgi:glycosyltransferase involved in cell wall biosynthesis
MLTKLMITTDWAGAGTGFSDEMRNVMYRLVQTGKYEVYWVGYNYVGIPLDIPASVFEDMKGMNGAIKMLSGVGPPDQFGLQGYIRNVDKYNPDFYLAMGDPDNFRPLIDYRTMYKESVPLITYVTLDGLPIHPSWKPVFGKINIPITMTDWACQEYQKAGFNVSGFIHHGVNWNWMKTNSEERRMLRDSYLSHIHGVNDETVIFIDSNSNQHRKRDDAMLDCWKAFKPETKNAKLFLNKDWEMETSIGWNLEQLIEQKGVDRSTILSPEDVYGRKKYWEQAEDIAFHRQMMALGDVQVSCTSGEGFGKVFLENMSLGIPIIAPDYAALTEVCKKGADLIPLYEGRAGKYRIHDHIRQVDAGVVNQDKFVESMVRMYDNKSERTELGFQGQEYAKNFDYDTVIVPQWDSVFERFNPDTIMASQVFNAIRYNN